MGLEFSIGWLLGRLGVGVKKRVSSLGLTHSSCYGAQCQSISPKRKLFVLQAGLEPARANAQGILSPSCLPLPPPEQDPDVRTRTDT